MTYLRIFVVSLYILLIPMYTVPRWCLEKYNDEAWKHFEKDTGFTTDCQIGELSDYPVSGTGYLNNVITGSLDLFCLFFLLFV